MKRTILKKGTIWISRIRLKKVTLSKKVTLLKKELRERKKLQ